MDIAFEFPLIIFFTVLEVVTPVFLLAAIGYFWVKLGFEYRVEFVTRLAMTLAVPALVFTSLTQNTINPQFLSDMIIVVCMAYAVVTVLGLIFTFVFKLDFRTFLMPIISGNTGNLGLPLCFLAFGHGYDLPSDFALPFAWLGFLARRGSGLLHPYSQPSLV